MTAQSKHEIAGNLREHPLFELLAETSQARLTGSFRLTIDKEKIIIYLNKGEIIYAVSNARKHRLFEFLLREKRIFKPQLANIENFVNDLTLGKALIEQLFISKEELDEFYSQQVEGIVRYALTLNEGFWVFNPLIRIKEGINFQINVRQLLLDFARSFPPEEVFSWFDLEQETFRLTPEMPTDLNLNTQEGFLFSRFDQTSLKVNELQTISGLPDKITVQILFNLWLGGFIFREVWDSAFSKEYKAEMFAAKVAVKKIEKEPEETKEKTLTEVLESHEENAEPEQEIEPEEIEVDEETLLEEYLDRVEKSTNFYAALGLTPETDQTEIKKTYFNLAKKYHPDLFHSQTENNLNQRIQDAFSKIAHAYDTLKNDETREVYNFKMRKELASSEKIQGMKSTHEAVEAEINTEKAERHFDRGFTLLVDEKYEDATPFLARAVSLNKNNAKYRAYYGKVLSFDKKQSHKAEAELREAIKLDTNNPTFWLILAEFYIQVGLFRRAEGELKRMLAKFPNDQEAKALLDSLQEK